jgi:hypothetical protein
VNHLRRENPPPPSFMLMVEVERTVPVRGAPVKAALATAAATASKLWIRSSGVRPSRGASRGGANLLLTIGAGGGEREGNEREYGGELHGGVRYVQKQ